jgi:hypothetical protein
MPTDFLGRPARYWIDIERKYASIEPILENPEVKRALLLNELKQLVDQRNQINTKIDNIERQLNE